jgi:hypothetical protein
MFLAGIQRLTALRSRTWLFPISQPQCHATRGGELLDSHQKHAGMTGALMLLKKIFKCLTP